MRSTEDSPVAVEGGMGTARAAPRPSDQLRSRVRSYWLAARWAIFAAALAYCILVLAGAVPYGGTPAGHGITSQDSVMADGAAYYFVETPYDWSDRPPGVGEYHYSPAFLWLTAPLRLLPWTVFAALWFAAHVVVILYLRVPWMLAFPGVFDDALRGNINTFLALAVVLVIRNAGSPLWSTVLLTKVTPGVGVIWHAFRREWRGLALALGLTAVVVAVGTLIDPVLWAQWAQSLLASTDTYRTVDFGAPLAVRITIGAVVCALAAWSGRAWMLPIGMILALPGLWPASFALLTASVVLFRAESEGRLAPVRMATTERDAMPMEPPAEESLVPTAIRTGAR